MEHHERIFPLAKNKKMRNEVESITESLGTMRINAKSGPRVFTLPVSLKENVELWQSLTLEEKQVYNVKVLLMKKVKNPIKKDELVLPTLAKIEQECSKAKKFLQKKI